MGQSSLHDSDRREKVKTGKHGGALKRLPGVGFCSGVSLVSSANTIASPLRRIQPNVHLQFVGGKKKALTFPDGNQCG